MMELLMGKQHHVNSVEIALRKMQILPAVILQ